MSLPTDHTGPATPAEPDGDSPRPLDAPPPRAAWEEPPDTGWASQLGGVGRETLTVVAVFAAVLAAWHLYGFADRLSAASATHRLEVTLLWCLIGVLGLAVLVFLWRRLGGLAFLGAMLTDYGRVARFGGRPPIWLDDPPEAGLKLAHLSDLHVTEGDRVRMVERAVPIEDALLSTLFQRPEVAQSELVILTGDITDRGTEASWRRFLDVIRQSGCAERVVLVPGNHDLSLIHAWGPSWRRNDRFGIVQLANLVKFCDAFAATGGGRLGCVWRHDRAVPYAEAWAACEADVRPLLSSLPNERVPRQRIGRGYLTRREEISAFGRRIAAAREELLALFPVAVPVEGHDAVLFVLNSCTPVSHHPATNALGWVGRSQYRRLNLLAGAFPRRLKLVALHHHVVRRLEERSRKLLVRIFAKLTVLGDASPLVRFCRRHRVRAVLNGHRHLSYQLRLPSGTVLLSAPSATLGDELANDPRPQFERYELAPDVDELTVGIHRRTIRLRDIRAAVRREPVRA